MSDWVDPGPWLGKACYHHPGATTRMIIHALEDRAIVSMVCGEGLDAMGTDKGHAWLQALSRLEVETMLAGGGWYRKPGANNRQGAES